MARNLKKNVVQEFYLQFLAPKIKRTILNFISVSITIRGAI
jgi:hypothetical protein